MLESGSHDLGKGLASVATSLFFGKMRVLELRVRRERQAGIAEGPPPAGMHAAGALPASGGALPASGVTFAAKADLAHTQETAIQHARWFEALVQGLASTVERSLPDAQHGKTVVTAARGRVGEAPIAVPFELPRDLPSRCALNTLAALLQKPGLTEPILGATGGTSLEDVLRLLKICAGQGGAPMAAQIDHLLEGMEMPFGDFGLGDVWTSLCAGHDWDSPAIHAIRKPLKQAITTWVRGCQARLRTTSTLEFITTIGDHSLGLNLLRRGPEDEYVIIQEHALRVAGANECIARPQARTVHLVPTVYRVRSVETLLTAFAMCTARGVAVDWRQVEESAGLEPIDTQTNTLWAELVNLLVREPQVGPSCGPTAIASVLQAGLTLRAWLPESGSCGAELGRTNPFRPEPPSPQAAARALLDGLEHHMRFGTRTRDAAGRTVLMTMVWRLSAHAPHRVAALLERQAIDDNFEALSKSGRSLATFIAESLGPRAPAAAAKVLERLDAHHRPAPIAKTWTAPMLVAGHMAATDSETAAQLLSHWLLTGDELYASTETGWTVPMFAAHRLSRQAPERLFALLDQWRSKLLPKHHGQQNDAGRTLAVILVLKLGATHGDRVLDFLERVGPAGLGSKALAARSAEGWTLAMAVRWYLPDSERVDRLLSSWPLSEATRAARTGEGHDLAALTALKKA